MVAAASAPAAARHGVVPRGRRGGAVALAEIARVRHEIRQRAVESRVDVQRAWRWDQLHAVVHRVHCLTQRVLQAAGRLRKALHTKTAQLSINQLIRSI